MAESSSEGNAKMLEELKSQDMGGFTDRGRAALVEIADRNDGALIFLLISLSSRITTLEDALSGVELKEKSH